MTVDATLKTELKELIIGRLKLEMGTDEIDDADPLFGEGLGLDSIDALELVLALEQKYGIKVEDEEVGKRIFASIDALAAYVDEKREG